MLLFDEKLLIIVMGVLLFGVAVKFTMPQIQEGIHLDLLLTFTGGFGMLIVFHLVGFIEGFKRGLEHGKNKTTMCTL